MSDTRGGRQGGVNARSKRSPAGEAFNDVLLKVLRLNGEFTLAGEALAKPAGQTLARWVVIAECKELPSSVSDIARRVGLARQSVQRVADLLVSDGLCRYQENPHHQRAKLLALEPTGRTVLNRIEAAQRKWSASIGQRVGEDVLRQASTALAAIAETFNAAESSGSVPPCG